MKIAIAIYIVCAILITSIAWIAVGRSRTIRIRTTAVLLVAALMPVGFGAITELLSRPKPVMAEWIDRQIEEATVLSSVLREDEAIYLWLQLPDSTEPRAYVLPWDEQTAREIAEAEAEGEATDQQIAMKNPFKQNPQMEAEPQFYVPPPPALPAKTPVVESPQTFRGRKTTQQREQSRNPS